MTEQDFDNLKYRGMEILTHSNSMLLQELNYISDTFIRKLDKDKFRREEDLIEICVLLGLVDSLIRVGDEPKD